MSDFIQKLTCQAGLFSGAMDVKIKLGFKKSKISKIIFNNLSLTIDLRSVYFANEDSLIHLVNLKNRYSAIIYY